MNISDLKKPFNPDRISWRVGSTTADKNRGMALAYIDSRDVQDRLDDVCASNWQCRYMLLGQTTVCEIGIRVGDEWVWRADGAGVTDFEAEKGALSDAFKRAAVKWGIGRYLYDVSAPWVAIEGAGKSFKIKESEIGKLKALLPGAAPPVSDPRPLPQSSPYTANPPQRNGNGNHDPKAAAIQWVKAATDTIRSFKDMADLSAWEGRNENAMVRLQAADMRLHDEVLGALADKYAVLSPLAAG